MSTDKSTKHRLRFFLLDFKTSAFGRKVTDWLVGNITPNMIFFEMLNNMNRVLSEYTLEKIEEAIANGPCRETGNTRYTGR